MNHKNVWHSLRTIKRLGVCFSFVFFLSFLLTLSPVLASGADGLLPGVTGNPAAANGPSLNGALDVDIDVVKSTGQILANNSIASLEVGEVLDVYVRITSTSDSAMANPGVSFSVPTHYTYGGSVTGGTASLVGNTLTLRPGALGSLASHLMTFSVTVDQVTNNSRECFDNLSGLSGSDSHPVMGEPFCVISADVQDAYRVINVCASGLNDEFEGNEECDDGDLDELDNNGNPDTCNQICRTTQPYVFIKKSAVGPALSGASVARGDEIVFEVYVRNPLARPIDSLILSDDLDGTFALLSHNANYAQILPPRFGADEVTQSVPVAADTFMVDGALLKIDIGGLASGEVRKYEYTLKVTPEAPLARTLGTLEAVRKRISVFYGELQEAGNVFNIVTQNGTPTANGTLHYVVEDGTKVVGNGRLETGEQCEDGLNSNGDGCSSAGVREGLTNFREEATLLCENGTLNPGESCSAADGIEGDGCNETCQREVFYCGNGIHETKAFPSATTILDLYGGRTKAQLCVNEQNTVLPLDVNLDGAVTTEDAQQIINFLNGGSSTSSSFYVNNCLNVSGDLTGGGSPSITPGDVNRINTYINNPTGLLRATDVACPAGVDCTALVSEQCDDGNFDDGDGCNRRCEVEAIIDLRLEGEIPKSGGVMKRGGQIWYNIILENPLAVSIQNVRVAEEIETGFTFGALKQFISAPRGVMLENGTVITDQGALDGMVSNTGNIFVFNAGTLFPGETRQYTYYIEVNDETDANPAALGKYENTVRVGGTVGTNNVTVVNENKVITYIIADNGGVGFDNGRIEAVPADPARCEYGEDPCEFAEECDGAAGCIQDAGSEGTLPDRTLCGNGAINDGEQCDDGNQIDGDACNSYCQMEFFTCGNGIQEVLNSTDCAATGTCSAVATCPDIPGFVCEVEACDDGNKVDGDGCSNICVAEIASMGLEIESNRQSGAVVQKGSLIEYEIRFKNTGEQSVSNIVFQNIVPENEVDVPVGVVDLSNTASTPGVPSYDDVTNTIAFPGFVLAPGEEAFFSFGILFNSDFVGKVEKTAQAQVRFGAMNTPTNVSSAPQSVVHYIVDDPAIDPTSVCTENGRLERLEKCDNGTAGCVVCELPPEISDTCGDGTLDPTNGEQCDDGLKTCIDGVVCTDDAGCDGSAGSCAPRSGDGCNRLCQNEVGICGNGIPEAANGEQCDDGNLTNKDGCNDSCQTETREMTCGDYQVDGFLGETCDDGKHCSDRTSCLTDDDCVGVTGGGDTMCKPRSGDGCAGLDAGDDALGNSLVCTHEEPFDIDIVKTSRPVSGGSVRPGAGGTGDQVDYFIKISNTQYRDIQNLDLFETLSPKVSFVSATVDGVAVTPQVLPDGRLKLVDIGDLTAKTWVPDPTDPFGGMFVLDTRDVTIRVATNDGVDGEIRSPGSSLEGTPVGSNFTNLGVSNEVFHFANDGIGDPDCGNGIIEGDEQCDELSSPGLDGDGCSASCQLEFDSCGVDYDGDGDLIDPGETCDDGARIPGDGCNETCQREWLACGNGVTENTDCTGIDGCVVRTCEDSFPGDPLCTDILETCDDGNRDDLGADGKRDGCDMNCRVQIPVCGDSVWEPALGEQCEDGNTDAGDGCDALCKHEDPGTGLGAVFVELIPAPVSGATLRGGDQITYEYVIQNRQYRALENVQLRDIIDSRLTEASGGTYSLEADNSFTATHPELGARLNAGEVAGPTDAPSEIRGTIVVTINADASESAPLIQGAQASVTGELPGDPTANVTGTVSTTIHFIDHDSVPFCSNGILEGNETCENRPPQEPAVSGDGCSDTCQLENPELCGNGDINPGEQCDDGGTISGDGCNSTCQDENYCGNGHVGQNSVPKPGGDVPVEQCDLGINNGTGMGCNEYCELEQTQILLLKEANPLSGSVVLPGDVITYTIDITNLDGETYTATSGRPMIEDPLDSNLEYIAGSGTNGITHNPANNRMVVNIASLLSNQHETYTFQARVKSTANLRVTSNGATALGTYGAAPDLVTIGATTPTIHHFVVQNPVDEHNFLCGNGRVESGQGGALNEQCDDGDTLDPTLVSGVGIAGCDSNCQFVAVDAVCGNDDIDPGETCDDGNRRSGDGCNNFCQKEVGICGNGGLPEAGEQCDDGNKSPGDGCSAECVIEPAQVTVQIDAIPLSGNLVDDTDQITYMVKVTNTGGQYLNLTLDDFLSDGRITVVSATEVDLGAGTGNGTTISATDGTITITGLASGVDSRREFTVVASINDGAAHGAMFTEYAVTAETINGGFPVNIINSGVVHHIVADATEVCGDHLRQGIETCDDGNTTSGDGCSGTESANPAEHCQFEGDPADCGNDAIDLGEQCDDGNNTSGDGCNNLCQMEVFVCGNGEVESVANGTVCPALAVGGCMDEQCDDQNTADNDGCSATCQYEIMDIQIRKEATPASGATIEAAVVETDGTVTRQGGTITYHVEVFNPMYFPLANTLITDPLLTFLEFDQAQGEGVFDDQGAAVAYTQNPNGSITIPGTPISLTARETKLYDIVGHFRSTVLGVVENQASVVATSAPIDISNVSGTSNRTRHYVVKDDPVNFICGNGRIEGDEQCDDTISPGAAGDGCSATCQLENPELCGNDTIDPGETCDDGPTQIPPMSGDGCNQFCQSEVGFCGNGATESPEECDDGNLQNSDGCSAICESEASLATLRLQANYPSGASVQVGDQIAYTLTLTNLGDQALINVELDANLGRIGALLPNYLNLVSITREGSSTSVDNGSGVIVIPSVLPGLAPDIFTITVEATQETGVGKTLDEIAYHVNFAGTGANGQPVLISEGGDTLIRSNGVTHFIVPAGQTPTCGNGRVDQVTEQCDHGSDPTTGNGTGGCSLTCQLLSNDCGDQVVNGAGEQCDFDTILALAPHGGDGCSEFCQDERGGCGNGVIEGTETCDDGNLEPEDGCSILCVEEPPSLLTILKAEPASASVLNDTYDIKYIIEVTNDGFQTLYDVVLTNDFDYTNASAFPRHENIAITVLNQQADDGVNTTFGTATIGQIAVGQTRTVEVTIGLVTDAPLGEINHKVHVAGKTSAQQGTTNTTLFPDSNSVKHYLTDAVDLICGNGRIEPKPAGGFEECDLAGQNGQPGSGCDADCQLVDPALCGNGNIDSGETCDDGPTQNPPISGDGCNRFCQTEVGLCGNNIKEGLEQCDEGDVTNGDGCSASCQYENLDLVIRLEAEPLSGAVVGRADDLTTASVEEHVIEYEITVINPNIREASSVMLTNTLPTGLEFHAQVGTDVPDPSALPLVIFHNITLTPAGTAGATKVVRFQARVNASVVEGNPAVDTDDITEVSHQVSAVGALEGVTPIAGSSNSVTHYIVDGLTIECGNGRLEAGEQCDDNDNDSGDGCSATCQLENIILCGNGTIDAGETCDDGPTQIPPTSGDGCNNFCQSEQDICGNGVLEVGNGETCDDGNLLDRVTVGGFSVQDGCSGSCLTQDAICADGIVDVLLGEPCDQPAEVICEITATGVLVDGRCTDPADTEHVCKGVLNQVGGCTIEPIECGDGDIEGSETCDDGGTANLDGCDEFCRVETQTCGNGIKEDWGPTPEQCDDTNTNPGDGCDQNCQVESGTPQLRLDIIANPLSGSSLGINDLIQYTLVLNNQLPTDATNVQIDMLIDTDLDFITTGYTSTGTSFIKSFTNGTIEFFGDNVLANKNNGNHRISIDVLNGSPLVGNRRELYSFITQVSPNRPANSSDQVNMIASVVMDTPGYDPLANPPMSVNQTFNSNRTVHYVIPGIVDACGNGRLEKNEMCDNGSFCSDGSSCVDNGECVTRIGAGEQCTTRSVDGCSATCQLENITCTDLNNPDCKLPNCGDSATTSSTGEQCDDGGLTSPVSGDGCNRLCQAEADCGNGVEESGEVCDDGNNSNGDGCNADCSVREVESCGNALVEAFLYNGVTGDEQCDNGTQCSDGTACDAANPCGAGDTCQARSGDGCSATCQNENTGGGGGGGGSAPVHSVVGVCTTDRRGGPTCSGARPEQGLPGWESYKSCLTTGGFVREPECARVWAESQGYTICSALLDANGKPEVPFVEPKMTDRIYTSSSAPNQVDDCAGVVACPNCCPGPNCDEDFYCAATAPVVPATHPTSTGARLTKKIIRTNTASDDQMHTILKGDEVMYSVDVQLGEIDNTGPYRVASGTVRVHDHTIPTQSGGIENRVGIADWFDCKSFPEACWTMSPSGLHGVKFEHQLSQAEIDKVNNGTSQGVNLKYTMDSRLAFNQDVAELENVAFAVIEYEFYDPADPAVEGIQTSSTIVRNGASNPLTCNPTTDLDCPIDACDPGLPFPPNSDYTSTRGQSTTLNLHRPFIQATGGGDIVVRGENNEKAERFTGDASAVTGGTQESTFGRIFAAGDNASFGNITGEADPTMLDNMQQFAELGGSDQMEQYYSSVMQNAHVITLTGAGKSLTVNDINVDQEIIHIVGNGTGQEVTISEKFLAISKGSRTVIIENADLIIERNLFLDDHYMAFIVRGGDIFVEDNVTEIEGVFLAEPLAGVGGSFLGSASRNQLRVSGALVGNLANLVEARTYIGDYDGNSFEEAPSIKLSNDLRLLEDTPPSLLRALGSDWAQGK